MNGARIHGCESVTPPMSSFTVEAVGLEIVARFVVALNGNELNPPAGITGIRTTPPCAAYAATQAAIRAELLSCCTVWLVAVVPAEAASVIVVVPPPLEIVVAR